MQNWQAVVDEAVQAPAAAATEGRVNADVLGRAALGRRVADAHERALREARELRDDVQRLISAIERDGIGVATTGNNFAGQARTVSGALIRLNEARQIFADFEGYRRAERDFAARQTAPRLGTGDAPSGEPAVEREEEETEG
jgi:hypothetical protein